ncbi:hypothetical protein [Paenibacillus apis]|uniref:Uncharacterized protein n=1 Tax=Paenibacillus apis TaxID=1792174 RepID=A0A919Y762_9BACL|nr:hypothetical protein [Paenibacillus apis]GIO45044.1 hypothetical protein J41TS4_48020 [Paenibacillus apis]
MKEDSASILKSLTPAGLAIGFLAGTTLGSSVSFLMELQPSRLVLTVALLGLTGAVLGLGAAACIRRCIT